MMNIKELLVIGPATFPTAMLISFQYRDTAVAYSYAFGRAISLVELRRWIPKI